MIPLHIAIQMTKDVWFGVHLPSEGKDWSYMREACLNVEASGYNLFTTTDHFMNMWNPKGTESHPLECWTLLSSLAGSDKESQARSPRRLLWLQAAHSARKDSDKRRHNLRRAAHFCIGAGWHEDELKALWAGSLQLQRGSAASARP